MANADRVYDYISEPLAQWQAKWTASSPSNGSDGEKNMAPVLGLHRKY